MSDRLALLEQMLEKNPNDAFTLFAIAKEYEGQGNDNLALHWYERLRAVNPAYIGLYYHLGKLYERQEQPEKALDAYDAGISFSRKAGNMHALNELSAARLNIADPEDDV
jgi:tetratricopeptide (TPR) repeat protein